MRNSLFFLLLVVLLIGPVADGAPDLVDSTYLRSNFAPRAIATDTAGNLYLAGEIVIDDGVRQTTALIVKLDPTADRYIYTRFLGGSVSDKVRAIAVDALGNVFVAGETGSPDFPVTPGPSFGAPPDGGTTRRSFVTKLDAEGNIVFSTLLGGSAQSTARAIAINSQGEIVVTGTTLEGFPRTPGAFAAPRSTDVYLLKLDPQGQTVLFSAPGIGGTSLAVDAANNIYVAGQTTRFDYPTTPGAYQTVFPEVRLCGSPTCMIPFQGPNQYITKVSPAGSQVIYSTALTGTRTSQNTGLAVDAQGNAYVTGFAGQGYPFTVDAQVPPPPRFNFEQSGQPFVSKLDPAGQRLLFSVPVGGAGIALGADGSVYAGGQLGRGGSYYLFLTPPSLESVPFPCLPDQHTIRASIYATQLHAETGAIAGSRFIGGRDVVATGIALSGSKLWIAGTTRSGEVPLLPASLSAPYAGRTENLDLGTYLGAVDLSLTILEGAPRIDCVVDSAAFTPLGAAAGSQLVTILGKNLGPVEGATAAGSDAELAGVRVNFGGARAQLLYVADTQINLATPQFSSPAEFQVVTLAGVTISRLMERALWNPSIFNNRDYDGNGTPSLHALNADGSRNSRENPAPAGSVISIFVNGIVPAPPASSVQIVPSDGWRLVGQELATPFVTRLDIEVPNIGDGSNFGCASANPGALCNIRLSLALLSATGDRTPFSPEGGGWIHTLR